MLILKGCDQRLWAATVISWYPLYVWNSFNPWDRNKKAVI